MAKVIAICGKICSGKSYYAKHIKEKEKSVILSCDELTKDLFDNDLGEKHDEMTDRIRDYLSKKALEILSSGTDVILEWGFWQKEYRSEMRRFFESRDFLCEMHYIDISDDDWHRNIDERNKKVSGGDNTAYYLDRGLMQKLERLFEEPERSEIDVWHCNRRD